MQVFRLPGRVIRNPGLSEAALKLGELRVGVHGCLFFVLMRCLQVFFCSPGEPFGGLDEVGDAAQEGDDAEEDNALVDADRGFEIGEDLFGEFDGAADEEPDACDQRHRGMARNRGDVAHRKVPDLAPRQMHELPAASKGRAPGPDLGHDFFVHLCSPAVRCAHS